MITRFVAPAVAALLALALAIAIPAIPQAGRELIGLQPIASAEARPSAAAASGTASSTAKDDHKEEREDKIAINDDQVAAAGIRVARVAGGVLSAHTTLPGVLTASQDRLARLTARVAGIVAEVRKSLGDQVARDEVLAIIESREIADAKGEFLTAIRALALAETTRAREARLWEQRISAEQDVIQARAAAEETRIRVDVARQRLSALGLSMPEINALPRQPVMALRRLEVRAPIDGQVTARAAVRGAAVAPDAELFSLADLSTLWVELTVPPRDLPQVRKGATIRIAGDGGAKAEGRIVFVSPVLDADTRSARAVAEVANPDGLWRPGAFVTVELPTIGQNVDLLVPHDAVLEVERRSVVFVRTPEGFEKRDVAIGREGTDGVEITFGLEAGTQIAVGNAFVLKAELGKSDASHD